MVTKKMSKEEADALLETLSVQSSDEELADHDEDTAEVSRVKAILRGDVNPHAREWGENWTHLNIMDEKTGEPIFIHKKNRIGDEDNDAACKRVSSELKAQRELQKKALGQ